MFSFVVLYERERLGDTECVPEILKWGSFTAAESVWGARQAVEICTGTTAQHWSRIQSESLNHFSCRSLSPSQYYRNFSHMALIWMMQLMWSYKLFYPWGASRHVVQIWPSRLHNMVKSIWTSHSIMGIHFQIAAIISSTFLGRLILECGCRNLCPCSHQSTKCKSLTLSSKKPWLKVYPKIVQSVLVQSPVWITWVHSHTNVPQTGS